MGALNFDFTCCPVALSVDEAVRRCDGVLSLLGSRRATLLKRVLIEDDIVDTDPNLDVRVETLAEADEAASKWIGREHLYRYPAPKTPVDIALCVWQSPQGCSVVATLERPDMRALLDDGDPFAAFGSTSAALCAALGAAWGLMRVDDDLAVLSDDDLLQWRSSVQAGRGDPAVGWVAADVFETWPTEQREHPDFRVLQTIDDYYVLLHEPTTTWFEDNV